MRDIKFRAWDKRSNKMLNNIITLHLDIKKVENADTTWNWYKNEVDLMQYTGLKDKTNKEIYEGDVLMQYDGTKRVVGFKHGSFVYTNIPKLNQAHNTFSMFWTEFENRISEEWEIIGNIYENPELLNSQNKSSVN